MAVAGRFITKWLMVGGMVRTRGWTLQEEEADAVFRKSLPGIEILF